MNKIRVMQWHEESAQLFFVQRLIGLDRWTTFACGSEDAVIQIARRELEKL